MKKHARHYQTNEPIPDVLLDRLMKANKFNQGFATIEFTASALVDQALHTADLSLLKDVNEFENEQLEKLGMPDGIIMRHRPSHFQHLFSSSHYSAG